MKHHFPSLLALLLTLAAVPKLDAVVYWPGNGSSGSKTTASKRGFFASELPGLKPKPLVKEEVKINGKSMTLEIYQLKTTWDVLLRTLSANVDPKQLELGQDYLKLSVTGRNNRIDRWLFVRAENNRPVTAFCIEHVNQLPPPGLWPRELPPLPSGSRPDMIMEIPRVNAVYGSFCQYNGIPEQLLVSYSARMAAAGWACAGAEHSPAIRGTGDIYLRNHPERQVLWIKFGANGHGAFYLKKLK